MLVRTTARTTSLVSRRGFHATKARMSSPYHYPEGPYSNIPFNPRKKWFSLKYWTFIATGFLTPFGIAGRLPKLACIIHTQLMASCAVYQSHKEQ